MSLTGIVMIHNSTATHDIHTNIHRIPGSKRVHATAGVRRMRTRILTHRMIHPKPSVATIGRHVYAPDALVTRVDMWSRMLHALYIGNTVLALYIGWGGWVG